MFQVPVAKQMDARKRLSGLQFTVKGHDMNILATITMKISVDHFGPRGKIGTLMGFFFFTFW